jgi:hypothetical protein
MKRNNLKNSFLYVLSVCLLLCTVSGKTYGQYKDNESNLPSTTPRADVAKKVVIYSDGAFAISGLAALHTTARFEKGNNSFFKPVQENYPFAIISRDNLNHENIKSNNDIFSFQFFTKAVLMQKMEQVIHHLPVDISIITASLSNPFAFKTIKGVEVGLKIRF